MLLTKLILDAQDEKFMEYIVKLCTKQTIGKETNTQELFELKQTAENTLYMLSTSIPELETILWNLLLRCFLSAEYEEASIILLRCLTHLASKGCSHEANQAAFVRCLICLVRPLPCFKGTYALNFLRNIKPCVSEEFRPVWDSKIPQLLKYLEQNYDTLNEKVINIETINFLIVFFDYVRNGKN